MINKLPRALMMILVIFAVLLITSPVYSFTEAQITNLTGKVEVKYANGDWIPAQVGMELNTGVLISTGFRSTAELELGSSTLNVSPLSRIAVDELFTERGQQSTSLSLRVGKIRAEVRTTEGLAHDFSIKSPTSTAAVRGTVFEYDGESLVVREGMVALANGLSHAISVGTNEHSNVLGNQRPASAKAEKENSGHVEVGDTGPKGKGAEKNNRGNGRGNGGGNAHQTETTSGVGEVIIEWR